MLLEDLDAEENGVEEEEVAARDMEEVSRRLTVGCPLML